MDYNYYNDNFMYPSPTPSPEVSAGVAAVFISVFFVFLLLFIIASYAITAFLLGRIFKKAGVPQWIAWVPVYNTWKLLELGGQQGFWAVLAFLPFVNIVSLVFVYIAMYRIGKNLGKEDWFVLLAIFVPIVWMIWLAFDDSKWPANGEKSVAKKTAPAKKTTEKA